MDAMSGIGLPLLLSWIVRLLASYQDFEVAVRPAAPVQGQLVLIELSRVAPEDVVKGKFLGRALQFYTDLDGRVRALAVIPLDQKPGETPLRVTVERPAEPPLTKRIKVRIGEGTFDFQTIKVDPRFISPPKSAYARIQREQEVFARLWATAPTPRQWRGSFQKPREATSGSGFGERRIFNGSQRSRHWGMDMRGEEGDLVYAIGAGTVVLASDCYYSGGTIVLDHGLGMFSLYFHLSGFLIKAGDKVERGQQIGKVGATGRATGSHLHLSTRLGATLFDPLSLINLDLTEGAAPEPASPESSSPRAPVPAP